MSNNLNQTNDPLLDVLQSLRPASPALSAHDIAFRAGYAAGRRRSKLWQAVALIAVGLSGASFLTLPRAAAPTISRQTPVAQVEPPPPSDRSDRPDIAAIAANLHLRDAILQHGLNALPRPTTDTKPRFPAFDIPGLSPWMRLQLERRGNM